MRRGVSRNGPENCILWIFCVCSRCRVTERAPVYYTVRGIRDINLPIRWRGPIRPTYFAFYPFCELGLRHVGMSCGQTSALLLLLLFQTASYQFRGNICIHLLNFESASRLPRLTLVPFCQNRPGLKCILAYVWM